MKDTDNTLQSLLDKSFDNFDLTQGTLIKANVLEIGKKWVTLDIGFKSDGLVSIEEFQDHKNELVVKVGDQVEVDAHDDSALSDEQSDCRLRGVVTHSVLDRHPL